MKRIATWPRADCNRAPLDVMDQQKCKDLLPSVHNTVQLTCPTDFWSTSRSGGFLRWQRGTTVV